MIFYFELFRQSHCSLSSDQVVISKTANIKDLSIRRARQCSVQHRFRSDLSAAAGMLCTLGRSVPWGQPRLDPALKSRQNTSQPCTIRTAYQPVNAVSSKAAKQWRQSV